MEKTKSRGETCEEEYDTTNLLRETSNGERCQIKQNFESKSESQHSKGTIRASLCSIINIWIREREGRKEEGLREREGDGMEGREGRRSDVHNGGNKERTAKSVFCCVVLCWPNPETLIAISFLLEFVPVPIGQPRSFGCGHIGHDVNGLGKGRVKWKIFIIMCPFIQCSYPMRNKSYLIEQEWKREKVFMDVCVCVCAYSIGLHTIVISNSCTTT